MLIFIYDAFNPLPVRGHRLVGFYGVFLGGLLITWRLFGNLHTDTGGSAWHMIPASLLEKFVSRLVLSTVIYTCGWYLFFFLLYAIYEAFSLWFFESSYMIFNPFDETVLRATVIFWICQSIMLFGVVYFRKYAFVKTVLAVAFYLLLLGVIGVLAQDFLFGKYSSGIDFKLSFSMKTVALGGHMGEELAAFFQSGGAEPVLSMAKKVQHVLSVYILMPSCWVMGYFRLKEVEV
jgi:hypothetical protein